MGAGGIEIFDISALDEPVSIATIPNAGSTRRAASHNNLIGVANGSSGILLFDIDDPKFPQPTASYSTLDSAFDVAINGNILYVAADDAGLLALDVSNPGQPQPIGAFSAVNVRDVVYVDGRVYITSVGQGLIVLDAGDPADLSVLDQRFGLNPSTRMAATGSHILVGNTSYRNITLYDSADNPGLAEAGYHQTLYAPYDIVIRDNTAFVTTEYSGLTIFNVSTCYECLADTNGDGVLSPSDFSAWIAAFNATSPACDQNGDTICTPADFSAWIANFNAGCPN